MKKPPQPLCTFLLFIILFVLGFYTLHIPHRRLRTSLNASHFLSAASNVTIASYLRALTLHPHLAGTQHSVDTAMYVRNHFQSLGLETRIAEYRVLLSYPIRVELSAHFENDTTLTFDLRETDTRDSGIVLPYHAYSPSGSVLGNVVFVNYGREEDYRTLETMGVDVSGCLVLARRGDALGRGNVVEIAETKGALGVLLYAERDEEMLDGVERGTVMRGIGDPLSPGWAGVEGGEKLGFQDTQVLKRFPKILSIPLSMANAHTILYSLGGALLPNEWRESDQLKFKRVGPGPTMVNLTYQGEKKLANIYNVFGIIRGSEEPDRSVLLGNHRDAWTYGAVDPNSGTAALLDIARRFALLLQSGWKPRRNILLCSWDAEEFGMVGSTEWVEDNLVNLAKVVAYLNVDCAVQGPGFFASATPQLDHLITSTAKKVQDPDVDGATLYENLRAENEVVKIQRLNRVDSDFAAFLHHAGVPSVDMYYGQNYPVYHTAFDSYKWMIENADPLFHRHVAVAGIWGLLALHLADESIIPFNYVSYAEELRGHEHVMRNLLDGNVSVDPLTSSIQELLIAAKEVNDEADRLREQDPRDSTVASRMRALNDRLMLAERGLLCSDGIKDRPWIKHLVYGPSRDPESKLGFFPGVGDAISSSSRTSLDEVQHEVWRIARAVDRCAKALKGDFF